MGTIFVVRLTASWDEPILPHHTVEDEWGIGRRVLAYRYGHGEVKLMGYVFVKGKVIIIKEPYLPEHSSGQLIIRVDYPSDIEGSKLFAFSLFLCS